MIRDVEDAVPYAGSAGKDIEKDSNGMIYECAPMEGVTGDLFRQAQRLHFAAADCYYTPFLSPTASRVLAARELREVEPSHNGASASCLS